MDFPTFYGSTGGDQRLAGHLAAENPLLLLLGAATAEEVQFEFLEVEEGDEFVECVLHGGLPWMMTADRIVGAA